WLIAAGGTLFLAFPLLYASSFSGFYLPLMVLLWLLIGRGIGIEFRTHLASPVWRMFFDGIFAFSSVLLAVFYGAAFANVIRGVPLDAQHMFFEPLWTNFRVGPNPGILDWYTVCAGVLAVVALSLHGALYLTVKTDGALQARARFTAYMFWAVALVLTIVELLASVVVVRPELAHNYFNYPLWFVIPTAVGIGLIAIPILLAQGREAAAFYACVIYLAGMVVGAAVALYPTVLPSSGDPQNAITIYNAVSGPDSLRQALYWWIPGMVIAISYFVFVYRMFRGKASLKSGYGH
ncbi:MAG TPA: cytochrome d ubiquinol oxidase subunit II, partial [Terriglobales bacterium]|nr:cytochrome d ubiquinol oxidase subunit II [Terriglobales bacterium]